MEEKEWFLYVVDHHEGPFSIEEIQKLVKGGEALASSYVWKEGYEDWVMMSDATEFGLGQAKSDGHGTPGFVVRRSQKASPQPLVAAVTAGDVSPSDSVWCLSSRKIFSGPHSMKTIVRKINDGEVSIRDSVWRESWTALVPIESIPEFMADVKAMSSTDGQSLNTKAGSNAQALGMTGRPSTRVYKWYKSRKFMFFSMVVVLFCFYQGLATGLLNPVLDALKVKEKVASLALTPIATDKFITIGRKATVAIKPWFEKGLTFLPENIRSFLSSVEVPAGMLPNDAETLREISLMSPKNGSRVATAMLEGDEFNPSFIVMSNAIDGTKLTVILRGKEGTLLNASGYESTANVEINKSVGQTQRFTYETNKPLPKGEYVLSVHTPTEQQGEKPALVVDTYFLGGKKDETYQQRLKEFNERNKARLEQEAQGLKQITDTIESMANESAEKFFALSASRAASKNQVEWQRYHQRYAKLSAQIKGQLDQVAGLERAGQYSSPLIYRKLLQTYELTERLHGLETAYIEKGGTMDVIKTQANQVAVSFRELKQSMTRLIK